MAGMTMPTEQVGQPPAEQAPMSMDHSLMDHGTMTMPMGDHAGHGGMKAALGPYAATREASGTAWQPDASDHVGLMSLSGDWTLMGHGGSTSSTITSPARAATTRRSRRAC